jgi:hypothetical protein
MRLHFVISAAGIVARVDVEDASFDDREMEDCVRTSVAHWRFAPSAGGSVEATFPFVFQSAG